MADERKRFYKGSGIAKHREWRGLKDTFYDYLQWAENLGILVQFAAKSPVPCHEQHALRLLDNEQPADRAQNKNTHDRRRHTHALGG